MPAIITGTQEDLDAARDAYKKLMLGLTAKVVVDQNGERVEFTAANKQGLYNYIVALDAYLNPLTLPDNGPFGVIF